MYTVLKRALRMLAKFLSPFESNKAFCRSAGEGKSISLVSIQKKSPTCSSTLPPCVDGPTCKFCKKKGLIFLWWTKKWFQVDVHILGHNDSRRQNNAGLILSIVNMIMCYLEKGGLHIYTNFQKSPKMYKTSVWHTLPEAKSCAGVEWQYRSQWIAYFSNRRYGDGDCVLSSKFYV